MRDSKMAELKFEAPLAQFEETDEWGSNEFQTSGTLIKTESELNNINLKKSKKDKDLNDVLNDFPEDILLNDNSNSTLVNQKNLINSGDTTASVADNFTETFSGSLEDLVNTFDEKITKCFGNYEESVEKLAPVQVRSQEEIMNECQMWWTITGNFGNILPIDWSKSCARKLHMPALNLNENKNGDTDDDLELSSEDEAVANDLDMHALILGGLHQEQEPLKTAEEVIQEIDELMQEDEESLDRSPDSRDYYYEANEALEKAKEVLSSPLYEDKLRDLSLTQLNELYMELEVLIREFSETLISELALRDELEYEKELKNTFISLLLAVQNKRRQYHVEKKRSSKGNSVRPPNGLDPKYLTTVIPYHLDSGPPNNHTLQVLIKILKAINEDSPTVPTLLTDYILKGCRAPRQQETSLRHPCEATQYVASLGGSHTQSVPVLRFLQEIISGVYLGPYSAALENCRSVLLNQGITHIICVRQEIEAHFIRPRFDDPVFTYLTLDIADMETENIIRFFPKVRQFIDNALAKNAKVLVHSNYGNSRSATLILAYVMEKQGLTCREAYKLVKERRSCISPNEGFVAQLIEYEPIYQARQSIESGQASTESQRNKRKSEHLNEVVEVDLIQPPPSPCNDDLYEDMCSSNICEVLNVKRPWSAQKC